MAADRPLDLACFSYLADAQVLHVDVYPRPNAGAVVDATAASIAGDGPLAAVVAASLGLHTGLIANTVGVDTAGRRLLEGLHQAGVHHAIAAMPGSATPYLTVIADHHTRTWFASLQRAYDDLLTVDLTLLRRARLGYIDCYRVITQAAARCINAAAGTPLLLNFGADEPDDGLADASADQRVLAVQTSVDEDAADTADDVADTLFDRFAPDAAVVTLGRLGALARTRDGIHRAVAPPALITHTHGAGAAFSAGYAHALLAGADIHTALAAGCRTGTAHCAGPAAGVPRHLPAETFATV